MFNQPTQPIWDSWIAYFERNAATLIDMDWDEEYPLSRDERDRIARSVQQFQLGESSEGNHVLAQARRYADSTGDERYVPALKLFIKEEQRHSQYLGRFMQAQNLPLAKLDHVDSIFRFLRRAFNLELSVMAMLTAEIIAVPYYKSLSAATKSNLLRQICRQLLRDEAQHLQFQLEILGQLRDQRSRITNALMHMAHRTLLMGAVLVVWRQHAPVLNSGGYSFCKFWQANWQHFNRLFALRNQHEAEAILR